MCVLTFSLSKADKAFIIISNLKSQFVLFHRCERDNVNITVIGKDKIEWFPGRRVFALIPYKFA